LVEIDEKNFNPIKENMNNKREESKHEMDELKTINEQVLQKLEMIFRNNTDNKNNVAEQINQTIEEKLEKISTNNGSFNEKFDSIQRKLESMTEDLKNNNKKKT